MGKTGIEAEKRCMPIKRKVEQEESTNQTVGKIQHQTS